MSDITNNESLQSQFYVQGFRSMSIDSTTISFGNGSARSSATSAKIETDAPIVLDTSVVGAGGVYPFPLGEAVLPPAGKLKSFWVYAIQDNAGAENLPDSLLINASPNALTSLPDTYNMAAVVGAVIVDENGNLVNFIQTGNGNRRDYAVASTISVLGSTSSTSFFTVNLTEQSGGLIPTADVVSSVELNTVFDPNLTGDFAGIVPYGIASGTVSPTIKTQISGTNETFDNVKSLVGDLDGDSAVEVFVSDAAASLGLRVASFTIDLPIGLK